MGGVDGEVRLSELHLAAPMQVPWDQKAFPRYLGAEQSVWRAHDAACQPLQLRLQAGYDHSYWFNQSFVEDHLRHHAAVLLRINYRCGGSPVLSGYVLTI